MNDDEFLDRVARDLGTDDVVGALAEAVATAPPDDLRQRVFTDIGQRPRQLATPVSAPELYALRVAAMSDLLDDISGVEWSMPALPYTWSVQELVGHLTVIEEYTARQFGLTDQAPVPVGATSTIDHLEMGAALVAELAASDPASAVRRWRAAALPIVDHVLSAAFDPTASVPLHAWPFDATTALVARAFEIWTHADDIRRATGRPLDVPTPEELRTMSSTSVGGLPILLAVTDGPPVERTRVVLTGPGGGTFDIGEPSPDGSEDRQLLVTDVVDYCRLVARRIPPAELAHHREGNTDYLDAVLRAAHAIAV